MAITPSDCPPTAAIRRVVAAALASLLLGACTTASDTPASQRREQPGEPVAGVAGGPLRLAQQLTRANVLESPLLTVKAVTRLADLGDIPRREIFAESFEAFEPGRVGWRSHMQARERPGGPGKALRYLGRGAGLYVFLLPATPRTHYRIQRGLSTSDPNVDLRIIETRVPLEHPDQLNHAADIGRVIKGKFVAMPDLLFVHRLPAAPANHWQLGNLQIFTTSSTRSLVLMLDDAESVVAGDGLEVWLDDLVVEELRPSREQELALLKGANLAEGADPDIGMVKHGQLLPTGEAATTPPEQETNFDFREAILAPAPTRLHFEIDVLPGARLSFSNALAEAARPGDVVDFTVTAAVAGQKRKLYERRVSLDPELATSAAGWRWVDTEVPLGDFAGQRIDLYLETSSPGAGGPALWGRPVIDSPRGAREPPNVLFIAVDTLRADRLSCYGHSNGTSPNIDSLATRGIRFDQAISASNWTTSAFASLFTGLMPSRHNVIHRARAIAPELTTMAELFRAGGWLTRAVAYKAYLYNMGFEQGFDTWFNVPRADNTADDNLRHAMAFLEKNHDRRFFLFFHLNDPHQPFNQPAPFDTMFNGPRPFYRFGLTMPVTIGTSNRVLGCKRCNRRGKLDKGFKPVGSNMYDGAVAYTDSRVGRLLGALEQYGIYDDTLIIFLADHGEVIWDRNDYFGHGGPYMSDELIRVPFIIKPHAGARIAGGKVVGAQVRSFDLLPTLVEMLGLKAEGVEMEAESLVPFMTGDAPSRLAVSENVKQHHIAIRADGMKYILYNRPDRPVREYLYDLTADPHEKNDLAPTKPDDLARLRAAAIAHMVRNRAGRYVLVTGAPGQRDWEIRIETRTRPSSIRSLFGVADGTETQPDGRFVTTFAGRNPGPLVLFVHLELPADAGVEVFTSVAGQPGPVAGGGAETFLAFREDLVRDLLGTKGDRAFVLAGPEAQTTFATRDGIDGGQLATLKALGYVQ